MKNRIRKILREEANKGGDAFYLLVDKRTNTVMDPQLWRLGFEDSGGSAYGTWTIDFEDPKMVAQYSFENMDEIEEVKEDIELEKNDLEERFPLTDGGKRAWNIQEEIDYYKELLQYLEVKAFTLAVLPYDIGLLDNL
jgi:hypothetical protein